MSNILLENSQPKQDILRFIRKFWNDNGYSPVLQEIADGTNRSKSTAFFHVGGLIASGHIQRLKRGVYQVVDR